jgi:hypothetical protein
VACGGPPGEALPGPPRPLLVGDRARVGRQVVAEDELAHPGPFGHAPDLGDVDEQRGHPGQFGVVRALSPEVVQVGHLVHQDVSPVGQRDQVVVDGGIAGEHQRPVRGVEPVGQRRDRPAVRHPYRPDPDRGILEDHDRGRRCLQGDVHAPDQQARVWHPGIQRHHVQVVGEGGQDVIDQVRRARGGQLGMDRRHAVEDRIAGRQHFRPRRPVHPDRRARAAHAPRVQDQARQVTDVVRMQMGQEHRLQPGEVQPGLGERGRRPTPAVHHEHPPVDDDRRRDPAAARDRHRRARRPQQCQFRRHAASVCVSLDHAAQRPLATAYPRRLRA